LPTANTSINMSHAESDKKEERRALEQKTSREARNDARNLLRKQDPNNVVSENEEDEEVIAQRRLDALQRQRRGLEIARLSAENARIELELAAAPQHERGVVFRPTKYAGRDLKAFSGADVAGETKAQKINRVRSFLDQADEWSSGTSLCQYNREPDDRERMSSIKPFLDDPAKAHVLGITTWSEAKEKILTAFGAKGTALANLHEMLTERQLATEDVQTYGARLGKTADFTVSAKFTMAELGVALFVKGLKKEVRAKVQMELHARGKAVLPPEIDGDNIIGAIRHVFEIALLKEEETPTPPTRFDGRGNYRHAYTRGGKNQAPGNQLPPERETIRGQQQHRGGQLHGRGGATSQRGGQSTRSAGQQAGVENRACYNCGRTGHIKRDCRAPVKSYDEQQQIRALSIDHQEKVKEAAYDDEDESGDADFDSDLESEEEPMGKK